MPLRPLADHVSMMMLRRVVKVHIQLALILVVTPLFGSALAQNRDTSLKGGMALNQSSSSSIYISALRVLDKGQIGDTPVTDASVDTTQDTCKNDTDGTPEPFFGTMVAITFTNGGNTTFRASNFTFQISKVGKVSRYQSPRLGFIGPLEIKPGSTSTLYAPIFSVNSGQKKLPGSKLKTSDISGFRTVEFRISGLVGSHSYSSGSSTTISFGNFDRCAK